MILFADLLNALFENERKPDGSMYSNADIEHRTREIDPDNAIHISYISRLRKGQVTNPTRNTILRLADAFNIEADYFFPSTKPQLREPDRAASLLKVALRSTGLNHDTQHYFEQLISSLQPTGESDQSLDPRK